MEKIAILCIEDEREVLQALLSDLEEFAPYFRIEPAENAKDAMNLINDLHKEEIDIGLILADHLMPGKSGVDLLCEFRHMKATMNAKKVLITAQAGLEATVQAVNKANLDHYIRKPWSKEELKRTVIEYLTEYAIEFSENPMNYSRILNAGKIMEAVASDKKFRDGFID